MITVFSKASLPMERGVGRIYSQSRGRGHKNFSGGFAPRPPQFLSYSLAPPIQKVLRGPWRLTVPAAKSEDCTTAPRHLREVICGVPQGSMLGLKLFSIM